MSLSQGIAPASLTGPTLKQGDLTRPLQALGAPQSQPGPPRASATQELRFAKAGDKPRPLLKELVTGSPRDRWAVEQPLEGEKVQLS